MTDLKKQNEYLTKFSEEQQKTIDSFLVEIDTLKKANFVLELTLDDYEEKTEHLENQLKQYL